MDEHLARPARARRVLLAATLGLFALGAAPWSAAAADASPPPDVAADASGDPTPDPTATPTPDPTATPDPSNGTTSEATAAPSPTAAPSETPSPTPDPTPTADPSPTPSSPPPSPSSTIQAKNLYRYSAMVRQYTDYWCVPAATQSMVNLVRGTSNKSYLTQKYYYKLTRQHNRYTYTTLGNDPQGWAWALDYFSKSTDYIPRAFSDKTQAVNAIAEAIQRTGHPVGVTVRGGTHAWVVLGYRYSVNVADPTKRSLLGLYVSGPLGTVSDRWPYKYLTVSDFRDVFTRYHEWQRKVIWEGKWVVISE
jgi:hypothetical protein